MLPSLEKPFVKHVEKWAGEFYDKTSEGALAWYASKLGIEESKISTRKAKRHLDECRIMQMVLVQYFATCRLLNSDTEENLARALKFVSLQRCYNSSRKVPPLLEISFYLSKRRKLFLYANKLSDIDFADIFSAIFFEGISITNKTWAHLTSARQDSIVKYIQNDMAFDQYEIDLDIPEEFEPGKKNAVFFAQCRVTGQLSIDKYVKIKKVKELFGVDVFDWFEP